MAAAPPLRLATAIFVVGAMVAALSPGAATASVGGTSSESTAGASFKRGYDDYLTRSGNRGYDVRQYRVALVYDAKSHGISSATAVVAAKATSALRVFSLDAKDGLAVASVEVNGRAATFRQRAGKLIVSGFGTIAASDRFASRIRYSAKPRPLTDPSGRGKYGWLKTPGGSVTYSEPDGTSTWIPSNDVFYDKAKWRVAITTPKGLLGVSTGKPVRISRSGDGRVRSVWRMDVPIQPYAQVVTVDAFNYRRGRIAGIPSFTAVARSAPVSVRTMVKRTAAAIKWLTLRLGKYPFPSTGSIVVSGGDSAMETAGRPTYSPQSDYVSRSTIVHEQAHQWFGNTLTARSARDMWLHEGFATYLENVATAERSGRSLDDIVHEQYVVDGWAQRRHGQFQRVPLNDPTPKFLLETTPYFRGQAAVHALRSELGAATFWRVLRDLGSGSLGPSTTTNDTVARISALSGVSAEPWADEWVRSTGYQRLPVDPSRRQVLTEIGTELLRAAANWSAVRRGTVVAGLRKAITSHSPMNHLIIDSARKVKVGGKTHWLADFHTTPSPLYPGEYRSCLVFNPSGPGIFRAAWLAKQPISSNFRANTLTPAPCP
ncbi:MAG: M1 family aminopeptidase [Candidatus Nanopelagicales bacterium]|nr:M1 family aminopeptidase [Candidatus Nanopelagicales bacterium]